MVTMDTLLFGEFGGTRLSEQVSDD
jgi:hypothetical protein